MSRLEIAIDGNRCQLQGVLNFASVADSDAILSRIAAMGDSLSVNFAGIERVDSAATAFMLELCRRIELAGGTVSFTGIPPHLMSLLTLFHLEKVLPLTGE